MGLLVTALMKETYFRNMFNCSLSKYLAIGLNSTVQSMCKYEKPASGLNEKLTPSEGLRLKICST